MGKAAFLLLAVLFQSSGVSGDWTSDSRNTWRDDDGEPRIQFNLRSSLGDDRWGFGVRIKDLTGLSPAAVTSTATNIQFSWVREAGTFHFSGSFDSGRGAGSYTFTPEPSFVTSMASLGYKNLAPNEVARCAMMDLTIAHVRGLAQLGYANLTFDDLVRTRIHKVTPEFVASLAQRGYKNIAAEDLVKMRIHNVTVEEMDALKAVGFGNLDIDDLVKFRIHKVTPDYIKSMKDLGYVTVTEDQLIKMRIHKVDAQFVRDARADGFALQFPTDAIDLAIHGPRWKKRG